MSLVIYSAGVLPYTVSSAGNILFLLGKDYDNKWSDFGGRCEALDKGDIIQTAARECWEETLGCIYELKQLKIILKKTKYIESKTQSGYPYYMYLLKIPYKDEYKINFKSTRTFINNINIDRKFKEKTDIRWFSLDAINNHQGFFTMRPVFQTTMKSNINIILQLIKTESKIQT